MRANVVHGPHVADHQMLDEGGLDPMVVIGAYNSSNTQTLARICSERQPAYRVSVADEIDGAALHHRPVGGGPVTIRIRPSSPVPGAL